MTNAQTEARAIAAQVPSRLTDGGREILTNMIATALAAKDAELAAANADRDRWYESSFNATDRAERAEAQLAKANKALEEIADAKTELTNRHDYSRGWNDALFRVRQIARRAREQGGE